MSQSEWRKVLVKGQVVSKDITNGGSPAEGKVLTANNTTGGMSWQYPIQKESVVGNIWMDNQWRIIYHGGSFIIDSQYTAIMGASIPVKSAPLALYTGCTDVDVRMMSNKISFSHDVSHFNNEDFLFRIIRTTSELIDNVNINPPVTTLSTFSHSCAQNRMRIVEDTNGHTDVIGEKGRIYLIGKVDIASASGGYVSVRCDAQFKHDI